MAAETGKKAGPDIAALLRSPVSRALAALVLIFIIGLIFNADGTFFKWGTHRDMLRQISVVAILGCGMTLVIITAGIDLSVGSVLGLTAVLFSLLSIQLGWSAFLAIPVCLLAGASCGAVSGSLIAKFKMQPFIATLAMMVFARGMAKWISGGKKVAAEYGNLPDVFETLDTKILWDNVAVVTLIFLACAIVCWILLRKLRWGRYHFAIGGNEEAARLSGVPVGPTKILAYSLSGLLAAVAGICQAVQEKQGDPETGMAYELTAIAIVVIGGTNLMGGRGGIGLTLIGALTIGYLEKILSINAVPEAHRLMFMGAIIALAVLFQKSK